MRRRILQVLIALALMSGLLLSNFSTFAQGGSSKFSGIWVTKRVVTRKPKPDRISPPKKRRESVRLLTIQWRVLKQNAEGQAVDVDPDLPLYTGERIQFAVKVNQKGYLYIVQDTEGDEAATIFPDEGINSGNNFVAQDVEYILPFKCEEKYKDINGKCWYWLEPPVGDEAVTVIFSRNKITSLPNNAEEAKKLVKKQTITSLKSPDPKRNNMLKGLGAGRFATWVTNKDVNDNEELVSTFYLKHLAPPK